MNLNPNWLSQRLLAIRLHLGLPCVQGHISAQSLRNETLRRSVSAYFHMILNSEMPDEPVHFGVQHAVDYKLMLLVCTQKLDVFKSLFSYGYEKDDVVVGGLPIADYILANSTDRIFAMSTVHSNVDSDSVEILSTAHASEIGDLVIVPSLPPVSRDSTIDYVRVECNEKISFHQDVLFTGEQPKGTKITLLVPSIDDFFDTDSVSFSSMSPSRKYSSNGIEFFEYFDDDRLTSQLVTLQVLSSPWDLVITLGFKGRISAKYLPSNIYAPRFNFDRRVLMVRDRMLSLEKRIRRYFLRLSDQLLLLDQTKLVCHNFSALVLYRFPMRMPSYGLINQSLNMVGWFSELGKDYNRLDEMWRFEDKSVDWSEKLSRAIVSRLVIRHVVELAPESFFHARYMDNTLLGWRPFPPWDGDRLSFFEWFSLLL